MSIQPCEIVFFMQRCASFCRAGGKCEKYNLRLQTTRFTSILRGVRSTVSSRHHLLGEAGWGRGGGGGGGGEGERRLPLTSSIALPTE